MDNMELHYNYQLQVWVENGRVQDCNHPSSMKQRGACCNSNRLKGTIVNDKLIKRGDKTK